MKLKIGNIEVEGKNQKEIEALYAFASKVTPAATKPSRVSSGGDGRGRKKMEFGFPENEFTVSEAAEHSGVSRPVIQNRLNEMLEAGTAKIVGSRGGGRGLGRAQRVYKVDKEFTGEQTVKTKKLAVNVNLDDVVEDHD